MRGLDKSPQSLAARAIAGFSPVAENGTKAALTTGMTTDRKNFIFTVLRGIMEKSKYPGIAKLVSRLVWDQETVRSSRTTRTKTPLKSLISEGFSYSLSIAAQNLSLSFLTYLFDSSCAKRETIIQVIRLSSIFSCMRTPSSRLSNFTFRTESADQICRQACLITI